MGFFFSKCTFLRVPIFLSSIIKYPINSIFSVSVLFLLKHFSLITVSTATVVRETNSFVKIMLAISPNYPWENGVKQIKSAEEKLSQSSILCSIAKDPSSKVKIHQIFFEDFYLQFSYACWVDVIYLICLPFIKSPWQPVLTFCAQTPLT